MSVNQSGKFISLDEHGVAFAHAEQSHPDARVVIATPGGTVPGDAVTKYNLGDMVKPADPDKPQFDGAGNAIYHDDNGRAHSVELLPKNDPRRAAGMKAEKDAREKADTEAAKPVPKPQDRPVVRDNPLSDKPTPAPAPVVAGK